MLQHNGHYHKKLTHVRSLFLSIQVYSVDDQAVRQKEARIPFYGLYSSARTLCWEQDGRLDVLCSSKIQSEKANFSYISTKQHLAKCIE